jgi:acylphosphatase
MGCKRSQVQILPPRPFLVEISDPPSFQLLVGPHSQINPYFFKKLTINLRPLQELKPMVNGFTAIAKGLVQGVGFRFFVRNKAISLQITGSVRNLNNGTVEIEAQGEVSNLEQLLHLIEAGPIGSRVEKVDIQWHLTERASKTFEIRG